MGEGSELKIWRLELKYCERCGALWLRRAGGEESYCKSCFVEMEQLPRVKSARKNRRAGHRYRSKQRRERSNRDSHEDVRQHGPGECVHQGAA